jgi:hypothetical protein
VAKALLADLVERGLATDRALVFVIDGSKALRQAITKTFGELAKTASPTYDFGDGSRIPRCDLLPKSGPLAVR